MESVGAPGRFSPPHAKWHCENLSSITSGRSMDTFARAATVFIDHVNLRQVVRPGRLWETRGSRLPLRGVIRLWIGIGSLGHLDGPRYDAASRT